MEVTIRPEDVLVVVPARNESETIGFLVKETTACGWIILVVDDQSSDETYTVARQAGAEVIRTTGQNGYGTAVSLGLQYALKESIPHIVTLDADYAHDPKEIHQLLMAHIGNGAQLTIGDRFGVGNKDVPSPKLWANTFASYIINAAYGTRLNDVACGFRVLEAEFARSLICSAPPQSFAFPYFTISFAQKYNYKISSAAVSVRYDGLTLHCTAINELYDLLTAAVTHQCHLTNFFVDELTRLQKSTMQWKQMTLLMNELMLILIPLPSWKAYIFQAQHPTFQHHTRGEVFDLRVGLIKDDKKWVTQ